MEKIDLKVGDKIRYMDNHSGIIDKIRVISTGKFAELKKGNEVEVGYSTKKSRIIASLIKVLY